MDEELDVVDTPEPDISDDEPVDDGLPEDVEDFPDDVPEDESYEEDYDDQEEDYEEIPEDTLEDGFDEIEDDGDYEEIEEDIVEDEESYLDDEAQDDEVPEDFEEDIVEDGESYLDDEAQDNEVPEDFEEDIVEDGESYLDDEAQDDEVPEDVGDSEKHNHTFDDWINPDNYGENGYEGDYNPYGKTHEEYVDEEKENAKNEYGDWLNRRTDIPEEEKNELYSDYTEKIDSTSNDATPNEDDDTDGNDATSVEGDDIDGNDAAPVEGDDTDGNDATPVEGDDTDGNDATPVEGDDTDGNDATPVEGDDTDGNDAAPVEGDDTDGNDATPVEGDDTDGNDAIPVEGVDTDGNDATPVEGDDTDGNDATPVEGDDTDGNDAAPIEGDDTDGNELSSNNKATNIDNYVSQEQEATPNSDVVEEKTPMAKLTDYMSSHEYGPGDFDTYSQDPEWRELQKQAFPDYELPPINQDTAFNQLGNYMSEHNYGPDDFDTYSQDPEWRELQKQAFPDYELPEIINAEELANGKTSDQIYTGSTDLNQMTDKTKLEDLSKSDYDILRDNNPERASQLLTDYNDRHIPSDDLSVFSKDLLFDDSSNMKIIDENISPEMATMKDMNSGQIYTAYPNPMRRMSHMEGKQGQNDYGMQQDCGIASTAKGINDLYGKKVTSENRLADYAKQTGNCDLSKAIGNPDGSIDYTDCGGTTEHNVRDFYRANGIDADAYTGEEVPSLDYLGERIKSGEVATVAVNHNLLWNFDKAQGFELSVEDIDRYYNDPEFTAKVDTYMAMQAGTGEYTADHFVNVSNVMYDTNGKLTHFIVSDTGTGKTKMIPKDYFQRAYNGLGDIKVLNQGCVIARRRK